MSYTFNTELLGLTVEVEGEFSPAEAPSIDCPGWPAEFEINTIEHKGELLEVDQIDDSTLANIEQAAFDAASDERGEY